MSEETKKVWRVLLGVDQDALENELNKLASEDLQIFRIDRIEPPQRTPEGHPVPAGYGLVVYDIIAFNPTLLASKAGASMQAMLGKLVGGLPFGVPPP